MAQRRMVLVPVALLLIALPLCAGPVSADGMVVARPVDDAYGHWRLINEETQLGIMSYVDGYENLILTVKIPAENLGAYDSVAWLYPVPSDPKDVTLSYVGQVTAMSGMSMTERMIDSVKDDFAIMTYSQVFTLPLGFLSPSQFPTSGYRYMMP